MSLSRSLVLAAPVALLALAGCGSPKVKCLPSNCSGCCDTDGECVVTPSELACGLRGASCIACFPGQACMSGFCTTTSFGGGTGGGEVGGGGGETGGGGGATGGGGGSVGGGGGTTGGGGGTTGGGGGTTGGGGGSVGGGGGTTGGGGGTTGGGGGTTGGGGGTMGGGGGTTGGGGGATGGGGGTPDTAAQLTAVRAAADQGTTTGAFPVQGALVTYVRPLAPDAGATDPAGFFVQAGNTGPALFVSVLASSIPVSVGDRIDFTVTGLTRIGQLRVATAISGVTRQSGGNPVTGLAQNINSADFMQASVLDGYESELVTVSGTLASDFSFAGGGFQSAGMVTTGNLDAGVLRLRLTNALANSQGLGTGCSVQLGATPMWRYNAQAQPSAFSASELTGSSCPTPALLSATAVSLTSVRAVFNRPMAPATLTFAVAGLVVSGVTGSGTTWTITTSTQTPGAAYSLVVAVDATDTRGTPIGSSTANRTAPFTGYVAPTARLVINEVDYDNVGTDSAEFIELYNPTGSTFTFSGESIVLQSGSDATPYRTIALPTGVTVPAGGYFLIAPATVAPGFTGPRMEGPATTDLVQNGGADGVALVSAADVVLDSLSYEGDAYYKGTQLLREGATSTTSLADSNTVNGSIGRIPNGTDSNSNATDFTVNSAPTPGAPNQP
jgi:hypothetical protein